MIRFLVKLIILGVLVFLAATVKLGSKTFFGHIYAIWHTEEVQDLKNGVEDKAGPALDRVKRGVKAGYAAATGDDGGSAAAVPNDGGIDAHGTHAAPAPSPAAPAAP